MNGRPRILIVGGGYGGRHTALRRERLLRPGEATVMIADPRWSPSMCSSTRARISRPRCASSPLGRTVRPRCQPRKRKKMTTMLTAGEQQELREIEQELRDTDCGFAWRLAAFEGVLRWSAPGRRVYLLVMALLAAALAGLAVAAGRLLLAFAEGGMFVGPAALVIPRDPARPGREPGQAPGRPDGPGQP